MARTKRKKQVEEQQRTSVEQHEALPEQPLASSSQPVKQEIVLTLEELIGSVNKVTAFRKHTKDFIEKNIDGTTIDLYETEMFLISIPFDESEIENVELLPSYKLILNLEKYEKNKYLVEPKAKTSIVRLDLNKPFVKIVALG